MTRDRFLTILQFLHLCDNSQTLPADHEDHDRIHKIRIFMEEVLIPLWQGACYLEQDVSVDETLVAFKGKTALLQYKSKKPHKWGLNVWTRADQDGYVHNWNLYAGKKRGGAVEHGLTYSVVTKLCHPIYNTVSENPRFSRCKICNANLHINGLKIAYLNERPLSKLWEL